MESARRALAAAGLVCVLALAGAVLPAVAALAALEEGAPAPQARSIPVAPGDPGSTAGRIVLAIADWLEERLGSGSRTIRLTLDAPMWAEEENGTVTVHLPGARLMEPSAPLVQWALGDLTVAVTPRSETAYDFRVPLPAAIDKGPERLTIGEGTVSGTWRSDLEITTRLEANARNLRLHEGTGSAAGETMTLGSLAVEDELIEGADGLWGGRSTLGLSDLRGRGFTLGRLDAASGFEDFERDLILQTRGDVGAFTGGMGGPTALADVLTPLLDGRWGRSEFSVVLRDLTATGDDTGLSAGGTLSLGRLEWRADLDGRKDLTDLGMRIAVADVLLGADAIDDIPPAFLPFAATIDIALERLPLRGIAEALTASSQWDGTGEPRTGAIADTVLPHLDAADSAFALRELRVVAPSYELRAEGRLLIEPASVFGVIGRMDARVRGLSTLMALAAAEGEEDAVASLIILQGLGRPVFEEGTDEPFYAYEIDLRRDGAVTVNGIPFDMLLPDGLLPE
ncbi:MAG: hypothetical protein OXI57_06655 [Rhodospirillales bacterium]|nr:hypothetical protein [Rhodospirillales bacterium]